MEETDLQLKYDALCERVEQACGRKMMTPKDFQFLTAQIYAITNQSVSAPTLRRIWGYQDKGRFTPRGFTLNILARYVGFKSWADFCDIASDCDSSDFINNRHFYVNELTPGDRMRIMWNPDRCVTIKFEGIDIFVVEESLNSKLKVGDRFCCRTFIQQEPLYLDRLIREGCMPSHYVCEKQGGIEFEVLHNLGGGDKALIINRLIICYHLISSNLKTRQNRLTLRRKSLSNQTVRHRNVLP